MPDQLHLLYREVTLARYDTDGDKGGQRVHSE